MATKRTMDIWFCDKCGKGYASEYAASICCKQYHCSICGIETPRYITKCDSCRNKELFEKAQKMTWEEYEEKFPGNMLYWNDEFYSDLGDLLDASEFGGFDVPDYVFGTYRDYLRLDPETHIAELIDEFDLRDRIIISSFNHFSVMRFKALAPEMKCGFLEESRIIDFGAYAKKYGVEYVHPMHWNLTDDVIDEIGKNGIGINTWTVNDEKYMRRLIKKGINAIIGNFPDKTKAVIESYKK